VRSIQTKKKKKGTKENNIQIQDRELGMHVDHLKKFEIITKELITC
jgi:hypothetical protein